MNYQDLIALAFKDKDFRSVMDANKINFLAKTCCDILEKNIQGDIAECGVYLGGTARLISTIFSNKKVFLFDSFCGFIKDDTMQNAFRKGSFSDTSLEKVKEYLSDRNNCVFIPGWLPESATPVKHNTFSLVHLDMDYYESTIKSLEVFWPLIPVGGVIIFDDWDHPCCPGVTVSIKEFFANIDHNMIIDGNMCAIYKT